MKIIILTGTVAAGTVASSFALNPQVSYVELQDTSSHAGVRKSRTNLKCVEKEVDFKITANASVSNGDGTEPTWSADAGTLSPQKGFSTQWTGKPTTSITATLPSGSANATLEKVALAPLWPQKLQFSKSTSGLEETEVGISNYLSGFKVTPTWSLGGAIKGELTKCDYYNDGEKTGVKASVSGTLTVKAPQQEAPFAAIPVGYGFYVEPYLGFNPFQLDVSVGFEYNEEKENPWVDPVVGSIGVQVGGAAGARVQFGPDDINLGITGTANVNVSGTGNFGNQGRAIQLQSATFNVGKVTAPFVLTFQFFGGETEIGNLTFVVTNGWVYQVPNMPKTIYTIPQSL